MRAFGVAAKVVIALYLVMLVWWFIIFLIGVKDTTTNYLYGLLLGVLPLGSGLLGFSAARRWGFLSSSLGRAVFFLSLGIIMWGIGTIIFAYYNLVLQVEVPYPSLADVAYIISWPLWGWGMINLSKATGAKYGLRFSKGKLYLFLVPIAVIIFSYYLLVVVARGGWFDFDGASFLKMILDIAYPVGDVVILTLATLIYGLSYVYLGGKYKKAIYIILAGFVVNYLADFAFSYTTTMETFYVGGWVDLLFTITMLLLSLGVNMLDSRLGSETAGGSVIA